MTWNSWHMGGIERKAHRQRLCSFYSPMRYSELPRYYREQSSTRWTSPSSR